VRSVSWALLTVDRRRYAPYPGEMVRRFRVLSAVWILLVVATAPLLIEILDDAGLGVSVPWLSVTGSEILLIGLLAAAPPLIVAFFLRRRSRLSPPAA